MGINLNLTRIAVHTDSQCEINGGWTKRCYGNLTQVTINLLRHDGTSECYLSISKGSRKMSERYTRLWVFL